MIKLVEYLKSLPEAEKYWIAYSGGLDSSVLLHLFFHLKQKINTLVEVVYVDHGLNSESKTWGEFCENQCKEYGLSFTKLSINEKCPKGESIEAWARKKRYQLIESLMSEQDILFSAHHQDDQVETFFLQALRSAGPRGLVAMPMLKKLNRGMLARPFLNYSREMLFNYAKENKLKWCEDESNKDNRFDRNYLRHNVLPYFESHWPAYRETITRLLNHQQEYKSLMDEIAANDLKHAACDKNSCLDLIKINSLSTIRQKNLLFYWIKELNLDLPASKHMDNIINDLIQSKTDKTPCVNWSNVEIRRYRDLIYAGKSLDNNDVKKTIAWDINKPIEILNETLSASLVKGKGISEDYAKNANLAIRYRQGGEKINPVNHQHSKTVKQLFQEKGVLPWYRDQIPMIYIDEKLAVIPGFCIDKKYAAQENESGWDIKWSGYEKVLHSL